MAERLSYLAEQHSLLPKNHFGARKRRSTVQALSLIQEKIYDAWRDKMVLSLVSFDVKGAYNGVNRNVLLRRLRACQVPEALVKWIEAFCISRQASIVVNGVASEVYDLAQAGLLQGSPLSPILFLFFNADLVQVLITKKKGALAFVDDFTAWIVGPSAGYNSAQLQRTLIPRVEEWEISSGATFQPNKTTFIHFTRTSSRLDDRIPLSMKGNTIPDSPHVKILGVVMDQRLKYDIHAARVAKRGLRAVMALKRLRGLRPSTNRQLFNSVVTPTVDYASPVWSPGATTKIVKMADEVQAIVAKSIILGFRTIARPIAEVEAAIDTIQQRWSSQAWRYWVNLYTLPDSHPFWSLRRRLQPLCKRFRSPLSRLAEETNDATLNNLERIEPYCIPPWRPRAKVIIQDRDVATEVAGKTDLECAIFIDASSKRGVMGIGVTYLSQAKGLTIAKNIGSVALLSVHGGELLAIGEACQLVNDFWPSHDIYPRTRVTVYSDSQSALRTLANPRRQSGQKYLRDNMDQLKTLDDRWAPQVVFRWVPGHSEVRGNEQAHRAARQACQESQIMPSSILLKTKALSRTATDDDRRRLTFWKTTQGRHTKNLDRALPQRHTKRLYDSLNREDASILAQLRTGKARLNSYLHRINAADTDLCNLCRRPDTVRHFLYDCARWTVERMTYLKTAGMRWCDIAYMLGGWFNERLDGPRNRWKSDLGAVKATIAFAKSTGRLQMQP